MLFKVNFNELRIAMINFNKTFMYEGWWILGPDFVAIIEP
jgi:hypothetical protein